MFGQRKFWLAAGVIMLPLAITTPSLADQTPGLAGNWARNDGGTRITIAPCGADLCAVNTWVKDPNGKEKIGDKLVLTLKPVSSVEQEGQGYDVRRQMHFKMTITLNGANAMQTSGCVLLGVICKNASWTRSN